MTLGANRRSVDNARRLWDRLAAPAQAIWQGARARAILHELEGFWMVHMLVVCLLLALIPAALCVADDGGGPEGAGAAAQIGASAPTGASSAGLVRVLKGESGERVWFDGQEGPEYEEIVDLELSPDGKRAAYVARKGARLVAVMDGREGPSYEEIGELEFGSDGRHVAYKAREGKEKWVVVVDGAEGPEYPEIAEARPLFSADGQRIAYVARRQPGLRLGWRLERAVAGALLAGPYGALLGGMNVTAPVPSVVVLDGEEGPRLDYVQADTLVFSPDSRRLAYVGFVRGKHAAVVDGKVGRGYDFVMRLQFSPDGKRLAYVASKGEDKHLVVVDGEEGPAFENPPWPLVFSPDSRRVAYVAHAGDDQMGYRNLLVVGGQIVRECEQIWDVAFTPDGRGLTYRAIRGGRWYEVVNGQESELRPAQEEPEPRTNRTTSDHLQSLSAWINLYLLDEASSALTTPPKDTWEAVRHNRYDFDFLLASSHLPATDTPQALRDALGAHLTGPEHVSGPGVRGPDIGAELTDPDTGEVFGTNPAVSRRKLSEIKDPGRTILVYQTRPDHDGSREALFADGHTSRLSEARWTLLRARSGIR